MDVFGGAPRFLAYPRPVMVQSGTDAVLKCQIGGDPRPAVIWERNNEKIDPQERYRVFEDGNVYNLIIPSVTVEDSGQYICKAKNSIGETYAAATLKVEGEAQEMELREENKPRFLIKPLSTRAGRGEDAVFSCKVWGKPKPDVIWEKDGKKLNDIFESTHFSVGSQDGGWFQLKIFKTRAPDGGVYTCKARNEFGEALAGAVLLVDAGPGHDDEANRNGYTNGQWKSAPGRNGRPAPNRLNNDAMTKTAKVKMFAVTEGKHAKFRCFVTGKPKPEIIWRKDGRLILSGRRYLLYEDREGYFTLKVLYCKQKDNGVYVCAASNTAGQTLSAVHLSVKEPPVRFKQPLIDLEVWERDLAVLECEVPEDSVPITWYLEDRRLQPGDKYGMEQWGTKRRLTIRDIGVDDDGIYLCEMPDGGRSIAEVAVKGTIVRKLPRKVDVLEGENAAFCVEVEEEEMDIHWYKDGVELRETHQTILKSFGRTHILVFVNTMPPDTGQVMFFVGRSKTSSQLRVKAARHCPPSAPVGVQINTERANAALLSWIPAQDSRKNPPSGYVLERQEVGTGSQEWLQCLTTDSATSVEILGDSVPCEADYRFRICSVNKYGKSNNVEFPRTVHLVPVARIQVPLQDAMVPEGQDALFSMELTASVIGTWFLSGTQIQEDERFSTRRTRTHQSLRIRGVRDSDNGAEITFIAYGIRDSAALYIQAPLVKFLPLSEMDRNKFVETGIPIVLYCELSDPAAPVHWYKNGAELQTTDGLHIQSEGTMRRIVIQSAEFSHSGVYCCDAIDDVIRFNVEVEAPPVRFSAVPEAERNKRVHCGRPLLLQCEVSEPSAPVTWHKDGSKLAPQSGLEVLSEARVRSLLVHSAELYHTGLYSCKSKGDAATFNVDVTAPAVVFEPVAEEGRALSVSVGHALELQCSVSDPEALVRWFHDDTELGPHSGFQIRAEGGGRTLCVQSAEMCHSGVYTCSTGDDSVEFTVDVQAIPALTVFERMRSLEAVTPLELECEVPDSALSICWFKDDEQQLLPKQNQIWDEQENRERQIMVVQSSESLHSALNRHETKDDTVHVTVHHEASSLPPSPGVLEMVEDSCSMETGTKLDGAVQASAQLRHKESRSEAESEAAFVKRGLVIKPTQPSNSGSYCCATADDVAQLVVKAPVRLTAVGDTHRSCDAGEDVDLICEVSNPKEPVSWFRDGARVCDGAALKILSHHSNRQLSIASAAPGQSGVYSCHTADHSVQFHVDVKAPLLRFSALPEAEQRMSVLQGCPLALRCELSDASGQVTWYKDGAELLPESGVDIQSEGQRRSVFVPSAERQHCGVYRCESKDDDVQFTVDIRDSAVKAVMFLELPDTDRKQQVLEGSPVVLQCELSQVSSAEITWSKDGEKVHPDTNTNIHQEGLVHTLKIHSAERQHSGVYECSTNQDKIQFEVDVKGRAAHILPLALSDKHKLACVGAPIVLQCQVSEAAAQVTWAKDHMELFCRTGLDMKRDGCLRKLMVHCAKLCDAGTYSCSLAHDVVTFSVRVQAVPEADSDTVVPGRTEPSDRSRPPDTCHFTCPKSHQPLPEPRRQSGPTQEMAPPGVSEPVTPVSKDGLVSLVQAPPVTFREIPEEDLLRTAVEQEELVLSCEVSAPEGAVQWYKDGAEVQPSDALDVRAEGTARSLTVRSARLSDTGTFSCRTGDNVVMFKVTVREPPVTIVYPKEDVHLDRHVPEEVILSCELSRANGVVSWFKDGQKLQESENIKLKVEGPYRRLKILSSRVEDSGEYVCDSDHDSIFFQLSITEPPVRIVSPSQSQMELCQQTSERMVLSCEISRPNAVVRWYRDGLQVEESQNLLIEEDGVYRRLIIPKTTIQDSAEYVCDTADDSMTFFVNIAEPPVRFVRPRKSASKVETEVGKAVVLDCEVSRPNAEVTWKRNGDEVEDMKNVSILEEGVLRQLTIHALAEEDAGQYVCDAKDDLMDFTVTVKEPPVRIVGKPEGRTEKAFCVADDIILVCEMSRANADVTWSKDGRPLEESERYCTEEQGVFRSLVVLNAALEDSGEYGCSAGDDSMVFHITVREPPVQIVGNSGTPEHHLLLRGEDLVLECEVSRPDAEVRWLRNGEELGPDERVTIQSCHVVRKFVLMNLQPSDSGEFTCDAADDRMVTVVEVQEPPVSFTNKPSQPTSLAAFEGESVTLSAELTRELDRGQAVRWLKDGRLLDAENIHISSSGAEQRLTLSPLQMSDSGVYACDAMTDQMTFNLLVREMKVQFVRPLQSAVALRGHSLTLLCEVNKAKGDVQWLKDGLEVAPSRRFTVRALGRERSFTVHEVSDEDAGEFSCASTDDRTTATVTVQAPRVVEFIAGLRNVTLREGEDAVFKCVVSPEDVALVWQINGRAPSSQRATATRNGTCHTLRLCQCGVCDSGTVSANAEGQVSSAELQVQEPQVVFTRHMSAVTAEELGEALLEVEVSQDSGEVQWMRQGVLLHAGPKYSLLKQGHAHSLRVHQLHLSDSGRFSCETLHDRTQAQLTVTPRKISITKGLSDLRTTERETASFEVHVSHPDLVGTWFRNGTRLKPNAHFRMSSTHMVHSLTISHLSVDDTGSFMFCVDQLKTTARLVVREPPVSVLKKLEDQKFPEGAVISIECELSRHNVDIKWMKNGVEVKPSKELRIYAMGRKRFLQVLKCRLSDSGVYTCDAGDASTSCSVEVYEPELLVVQELEDLEIEEDQNAIFMCEVSVEEVQGEWYKKNQKIQNTSSIKTRQEGSKHFLLMCNVRPEDSGEIKFVARHVQSVAFLDVEELPVSIVKPLQDTTAMEKTRVLLDCTVSNPRCSCRWYRGCSVILPSERFEICSEGCTRKLIIQQVALEDEGTYSVQVGEHSCSARLSVEAQSVSLVRGLSDLQVVAPDDARFEVEVSVPLQMSPVWTLKGVALRPGPGVLMEKMGTLHRLTLRQTTAETSGDVEFVSGKTRSRARLAVVDPE
ncbi:obscurin isoform X4 [Eucyclogobius newberryi]|uniref:obscurin isoform X4 n=1 Tax=Eucyclogobius newberryi TaxID=166745 RepID=UPI003B5C79D6